MTDNIPTFHHLNNSASQRILWLLEELKTTYNLITHTRNPPNHPTAPFLSPPSLKATGPYGKSPLLITRAKDGKRYIPEAAAIATYLIRTFDTCDYFGLRNGDWIRDDMLTSVILTDLSKAMGVMLMLDCKEVVNGEYGEWDGPNLRAVLGNLEKELVDGPEGGYFMGERPGRADILLEFPMAMITQREWVDLGNDFPVLNQWLERSYARGAWKRGLEKGNGYDLSSIYAPSRYSLGKLIV